MASGTFSKVCANYWTLIVNWTSVADAQTNSSSVSITVTMRTPKFSIGARNCTVTIGGVSQTLAVPAIKTDGNATVTLGSAHQIVNHGADGTKTIGISFVYPVQATLNGVYYSSWTVSDSNVVLDNIPRYATVTQALSYKDETRIFTTWTSSAPVDYVWESSDNGVTWTGSVYHGETSGSTNFYNLTPGTNYNLKIKVRRQDNQLVTESTALAVSTYYWPYCTAAGNFTVGGTATLTIYNPMNRSYSVSIKAESAAFYDFTGTYNGGTANIDTSVAAVKQYFYEAITSSSSGTYTVKITPATIGSTPTTSGSGTFTANPADCAPTIGALAYRDTNATTVAITGDDQDIVQNKSTVQYTATGLTGKYNATIVSASVEVNGQTYSLTISSGTATGGNAVINSASSVYATLTVTDSRGITSTAQVYVNILAWSVPSAIITCERQDNFYTATDLTVDAEYASLHGGNSVTITYAATKEGDVSPTVTGSLSDNVTSTANLDNNYAWDIAFTVADLLGTATFSSHISRGMPIIYFDRKRSSVSINCFPQTDKSLEVDGQRLNNVKMYAIVAGTAADASNCAKWDVSDDTVAQYYDGMICSVRVPVAGSQANGTCFQIGSLGYKPVVYGLNSGIEDRYPAGANVICVYNATQTATAMISGTATTITGCWQICDYAGSGGGGGGGGGMPLSTATVTLAAASWVETAGITLQLVAVTGMTTTAAVWVSPAYDSQTDYAEMYATDKIVCAGQNTNTLTFRRYAATSSGDIVVNVVWAEDVSARLVPSGGTTGQVLAKKTNTDYDTEWVNQNGIPSGGTAGQVLAKGSATDYDAIWTTPPSGLFWVTYNTTTFAEISTAIAGGKLPVMLQSNRLYVCTFSASASHKFTAVIVNSDVPHDYGYVVDDTDNWTSMDHAVEVTSHKVTSLSSSSTDTQYPSAKAVYDTMLKKKMDTVLLVDTDWVIGSGGGYLTQTVLLSDALTSTETVWVSPDPTDIEAYAEAKIYCYTGTTGSTGSLEFRTIGTPTISSSITVNITWM